MIDDRGRQRNTGEAAERLTCRQKLRAIRIGRRNLPKSLNAPLRVPEESVRLLAKIHSAT